jgi:hypothetical protein
VCACQGRQLKLRLAPTATRYHCRGRGLRLRRHRLRRHLHPHTFANLRCALVSSVGHCECRQVLLFGIIKVKERGSHCCRSCSCLAAVAAKLAITAPLRADGSDERIHDARETLNVVVGPLWGILMLGRFVSEGVGVNGVTARARAISGLMRDRPFCSAKTCSA